MGTRLQHQIYPDDYTSVEKPIDRQSQIDSDTWTLILSKNKLFVTAACRPVNYVSN